MHSFPNFLIVPPPNSRMFSKDREVIPTHLHAARDALPLTQDLVQVLRAKDVPQRRLGQQSGDNRTEHKEMRGC